MLYPENLPYVEDLLGYIAVGARSVENQQYRLVASGIDYPVGMKNPSSGDLSIMTNAIFASQNNHRFIYRAHEVETSGNEFAHAILRGAKISPRLNKPNYYYEDINNLLDLSLSSKIKNPSVIIDCNHFNSNKDYKKQPEITKNILKLKRENENFSDFIKGIMLDSYLK
jgi:3-deoxy-7-phosphoheptulonate synthase